MYSKKVKKNTASDSEVVSEEDYVDDLNIVQGIETSEMTPLETSDMEEKHNMDMLIHQIIEDIQDVAEFQVMPLAEHLTPEHVRHLFTKLNQI